MRPGFAIFIPVALGASDLHQQHNVGGDGLALLDFCSVGHSDEGSTEREKLQLPFRSDYAAESGSIS